MQDTIGVDFQGFFDLLQQVGEERRLMDLMDEEVDNWLAVGVVKDFLGCSYRGIKRLMMDITPTTTASADRDVAADIDDLL